MEKFRFFVIILALAGVCVSQLHAQSPESGQTLVGSVFKGGTDGWKGETDAALWVEIAKRRGQVAPPKTRAHERQVQPTRDDGSPTGGFITLSEVRGDGQTLHFSSPNKYVGDRRAAYGGSIVVQIRVSTTSRTYKHPFIIIASKKTILFYFIDKNPGTAWERIEVPLKEGPGWVNPSKSDYEPATKADFDDVLGSLSYLWIRAEYSSGDDRVDLAEIRLNKPLR